MYASFDLDACRLVHVHTDYRVVSLLALLELPHVAVAVKCVEAAVDLVEFTELELRTMLAHRAVDTTAYHTVPALAQQLVDVVSGMPPADAVYAELVAQVKALPPGHSTPYTYVRGSAVAAQLQQLLPDVTIESYATKVRVQPGAPVPRATAPKPGSVTALIAAECLAAWEHGGKPRDGAALVAARKAATNALAAAGINPNSASKGCGIWFRNVPK